MSIIKTKRLTLRPIRVDDAPAIVKLADDFEIARQTATMPFPFILDDAENWIASLADTGEVVFSITAGGQVMGKASYKPIEPGLVEISYWLGREYWGYGFATEAANGVLDAIFYDHEVSTVIAVHADDNPTSKRVIEKLGFQLVGETEHYSLARDEDVPCLLYQMDREHYFTRYST